MHHALTGHLVCPSCRVHLRADGAPGNETDWGLVCPRCNTGVPVVDGFAYFTETTTAPNAGDWPAAGERLRASDAAYRRFVTQAAERPSFDVYAAFAPFNEATRALYPFIDALNAHLKPGDLIVDLWCRSGWTSALLAGLFPEQHVVALWEGPSNTLGYVGFRHWLSEAERPANWSVLFVDPRRGLPFADGAVALVHGADALHRFPAMPLLSEILRINRRDGAMIFPHVHLANSEPDPFFERGGTILHGSVYRGWLDGAIDGDVRRGFVLAERELFETKMPRPLTDQTATEHYNGLIAVLRTAFDGAAIGPAERAHGDDDYLIPNPLLRIDLDSGDCALDETALGGKTEYLLLRHPVYRERLAARLPFTLSDDERRILLWARLLTPLKTIRARLGLAREVFDAAIARLQHHEIALAAPVGEAMARLQMFHAGRVDAVPLTAQHFGTLWQSLAARYGERPVAIAEDGSAFGHGDVADVVAALAALLNAGGVGPGRPLALVAATHAEAVFAIWAAWLIGAAVAPLDAAMPPAQLASLIERLQPALVIADGHIEGVDTLRFDALADAFEPHLGSVLPQVSRGENDDAAILFTSGSTGAPKGVVLTHGALYRGGVELSRGLGWNGNDRLWSPGGLHTMSGLRNPCVAALAAGATLVIADPQRSQHPVTAADACRTHGVTLLATVPAFLSRAAAASAKERLRFGTLRQVAVTGSMLGVKLEADGAVATGATVRSYYGLTETAGVCLIAPGDETRSGDGDIGVPAGALVRIVDGELQIYSANLTRAYLGDATRTEALFDDGWLKTGDVAARDANSHIVLLGRHDEQIKNRFGEIVHPAVIESAVARRDDITEVAVVAATTRGETRVTAFVVPKQAADAAWQTALRHWMLAELGPRQMPECVTLVAALPRLGSGKIDRESLRRRIDGTGTPVA